MTTPREKLWKSGPYARAVHKGFTLIELMITLVIVAVGVAIAVPTYENTMQKRRVTSAAESIASFLALAQGEAMKRNETVAITVRRESGTTWCAGAMLKNDDADFCDCRPPDDGGPDPSDDNYCDFDPDGAGEQRLISQEGFERFTMDASRSERSTDNQNNFSFSFDPVRGIKVDSSTGLILPVGHDVTLLSKNEKYSLMVDISVTGRISICTASDKKVPGFKPCA